METFCSIRVGMRGGRPCVLRKLHRYWIDATRRPPVPTTTVCTLRFTNIDHHASTVAPLHHPLPRKQPVAFVGEVRCQLLRHGLHLSLVTGTDRSESKRDRSDAATHPPTPPTNHTRPARPYLQPIHAEAVPQLPLLLPTMRPQRGRGQHADHALEAGVDDAPLVVIGVLRWLEKMVGEASTSNRSKPES